MPFVGSIYFGLSKIFDLRHEAEVLGLLIIVITLVGFVVQFGARRFEPKTIFQGELIVTQSKEGKKIFSLELDRSPEDIINMESITFKVIDIEKEALAE